MLRPVLIFLALAALLIDIVFAVSDISRHHSLPISMVTSTMVHTKTTTPGQTPSSVPLIFSIARTYSGSIHNTPAQTNATMRLTNIQQHSSAINGYLILGSGLSGDGSFDGTITTQRHISFLVASQAGHLPLLFMGQVGTNGSMSGTYCSAQNNQCDYAAGGYGTWSVSPSSSTA